MIIPEKNRREISEYLFQEGVFCAKKDFDLAKHPEIDVPNLHVIKLMQSFKSKENVRETFTWMHYYWYLTNDGIEFLRTYLNLPSEIVPTTLKKSAKPLGHPMGGPPSDRPRGPPRFDRDRPRFGDRERYRSGPVDLLVSLVVRKVELLRITSLLSGVLVEGLALAMDLEVWFSTTKFKLLLDSCFAKLCYLQFRLSDVAVESYAC
ncbi:unnamed protein product [Coffea canephora]|uniref:DH200=94 genomic scaffold, scaffold_242 n=1 Tax=Coffea canephora TaxID=49390 RepID=A0A068VCJ8_COFCA|nr:unnamed protein product [Coffea canephora]